MQRLANATGSGWKGYTGGALTMLLGVIMGIDATELVNVPGVDGTFQGAWATITLGLAAFGIRQNLTNRRYKVCGSICYLGW